MTTRNGRYISVGRLRWYALPANRCEIPYPLSVLAAYCTVIPSPCRYAGRRNSHASFPNLTQGTPSSNFNSCRDQHSMPFILLTILQRLALHRLAGSKHNDGSGCVARKSRLWRSATAAKTPAIPSWQNHTHHNSLEAPRVSAKRGLGHSVSSFGRISVSGCAWDGWDCSTRAC
jgi:hypothetical protein